MDVDISHVHTNTALPHKLRWNCTTTIAFLALHRRRDGRLCPERRGLRLAAQYDIVHAAIWGHAEDAFPHCTQRANLPLSTSPTSGTARSADTGAASRFCLCLRAARRRTLRLKMKAIVARGAGVVIVTWVKTAVLPGMARSSGVRLLNGDGYRHHGCRRFVHCRIPLRWSAGMTLPQAMAQGTACAAKLFSTTVPGRHNVGVSIFTPRAVTCRKTTL